MESRPNQSSIDLAALELSATTALAAIEWAWVQFGERCCVLSSMQDAVLIDLAMQVDHHIPIVFLDTGYHFLETLQTLRSVEDHYGIEVDVLGPLSPTRSDVLPGECCSEKPALLDTALAERDCWISGLSRHQTENRANAKIVEQNNRGKVKVNPLAQWSSADRDRWIKVRKIITNPLLAEGYQSIGCATCTTETTEGERSGRWAGKTQTECGLHL